MSASDDNDMLREAKHVAHVAVASAVAVTGGTPATAAPGRGGITLQAQP